MRPVDRCAPRGLCRCPVRTSYDRRDPLADNSFARRQRRQAQRAPGHAGGETDAHLLALRYPAFHDIRREHVRALLDLLFKHTNSNRKKNIIGGGKGKEFLQIVAEENRFHTYSAQPKKLNKSNQIAHHHLLQLASHT